MAEGGFKLFVADLPQDITQEEIQAVFQTYGEVSNIYILQPNAKGGGRASLVTYTQRQSAEDAISVLHGQYKIRVDAQYPIKVQWAKDKGQTAGPQVHANDPLGFKLFVGGLPNDCSEEELKMVFTTYGEVNKVHMMPPSGDSGRVAAFIYYKAAQSGEDAIQVLHDKYKIRADAEKPVLVKWAQPKDKGKGKGEGKGGDQWGGDQWGSSGGKGWGGDGGGKGPFKAPEGWKLFIGGLPGDITEGEMMSVFQTYGEVAKVHLLPQNNMGKVAGFVYYANDQSGEDAIKVLNGQYKIRVDAAEPIQVRWANERGSTKGGATDAKGNWAGGSSWDSGSGGGGKGGWDSSSGGKGAGGGQAAVGWDQSWSGGGAGGGGGGGGSWNSGPSWGGDQGGKGWGGDSKGWSGGGGKGGGKGEGGGPPSETKLFVGNLPEDITEDALKYVFGTYGTVRSVHVMMGRSKSGMACAFVDLSAPSEADTAITTLNDKYEIKPGAGVLMVKKARGRSGPY